MRVPSADTTEPVENATVSLRVDVCVISFPFIGLKQDSCTDTSSESTSIVVYSRSHGHHPARLPASAHRSGAVALQATASVRDAAADSAVGQRSGRQRGTAGGPLSDG